MKKNALYKAHRTTKILSVMLFIIFFSFCLSSVTAQEVKTYYPVKDYTNIGDYGKITIDSKQFVWSDPEKLVEHQLLEVKDSVINAYARGKSTLYVTGALFDDKFLYGLKSQLVNMSDFKIYVIEYKNVTTEQKRYIEDCKDKKIEGCETPKIEYYNETKEIKVYKNAIGRSITIEKGSPKTFEWVIYAKKSYPNQRVDFVLNSFGQDLTEWAWWDTDFESKRKITLTNQVTKDCSNCSFDLSINAANITNYATQGIEALRFTNASETEEYSFYVWANTTDQINVTIRVTDTLGASGTLDIYSYFNNAAASSASDFNTAYLFADNFEDGSTTDAGDFFVTANESINSTEARGSYSYGALEAGTDGDSLDMDLSFTGGKEYEIHHYFNTWTDGGAPQDWYMMLIADEDGTFWDDVAIQLYTFDDGSTLKYYAGSWIAMSDGYTNNDWTKLQVIVNATKWLYKTDEGADFHVGDYRNTPADLSYYVPNPDTNYGQVVIDDFYVREYLRTAPSYVVYALESSPSDLNPNITLNHPPLASNWSTQNVLLNCSGADDQYVQNITLWINGQPNQTQAGSGTILELSTNLTFAEGSYAWTCLITDNASQTTWAGINYTFLSDGVVPTLSATQNLTDLSTETFNVSSIWAYNASDLHLSKCWYFTSDYPDNLTITCNDTITTQWDSAGSKTIYYFANDTYGNENSASDTLTISSHQYTQETSNTNPAQSASVSFNLTINFSFDITSFNTSLVWNNTNYYYDHLENTTRTALANKTITIPTDAEGTINWYWNYTINGDNYTTSSESMGILTTALTACDGVYTTQALNFTILDENNLSTLNTSTFEATFTYWTDDPTASKNYSYSNLSRITDVYPFCISPANVSFIVNMDAEYDATGYTERTYYLRNATISNQTSVVDLYLLHDNDDTKFYIDVKHGTDEVEFGRVLIKKYFVGEGVYRTIGIRLTDEDGEFIEYLELDKPYQFQVIDSDGIVLGSVEKTASCSAAPCTMSINVQDALSSIYEGYYAAYGSNVVYNLSFNRTNKIVTFDYVDVSGLATYARLWVTSTYLNSSVNTICDTSLYSVSGTISCNLSAYDDGDFLARAYISRSPELLIDFLTIVISSLVESLGVSGLLVSILLLVSVFFAFKTDMAIGVLSIPLCLTILKLSSILPLSWTPIALFWLVALFLAAKIRV